MELNFFGLNHIAIGGLVPVIEGAGRRLALQRGLGPTNVREVFLSLAEDCKNESITKNIGATDEIVSMMDSFATFTSSTCTLAPSFTRSPIEPTGMGSLMAPTRTMITDAR